MLSACQLPGRNMWIAMRMCLRHFEWIPTCQAFNYLLNDIQIMLRKCHYYEPLQMTPCHPLRTSSMLSNCQSLCILMYKSCIFLPVNLSQADQSIWPFSCNVNFPFSSFKWHWIYPSCRVDKKIAAVSAVTLLSPVFNILLVSRFQAVSLLSDTNRQAGRQTDTGESNWFLKQTMSSF